MQWNIRSLVSNKHALLSLIWEHNPQIIALNETWMKNNKNVYIKGYNIIRNDRDDGYGGVAILVQKHISYEVIQTQLPERGDNFQFLGISIGKINILTAYIPRQSPHLESYLNLILNHIEGEVILVGDLNAHSHIWSRQNVNPNGRSIINIISEHNLVVHNDGTPTRITSPNQNESSVDLTISSMELASNISWEVVADSDGSDHFPTLVKIKPQYNLNDAFYYNSLPEKRMYHRANWTEFEYLMEEKTRQKSALIFENLDEIIQQTAEATIPRKKACIKRRTGNPWWDKECSQKVKERKAAIDKYKKSVNMDNYMEMKHTIAKVRRLLKKRRGKSS